MLPRTPSSAPKAALVFRILHLITNGATSTSALGIHFANVKWRNFTPTNIYKTLNTTVKFLGPSLSFKDSDVSTRSLQDVGTMPLICIDVDSNIINLIGRWHLNDMLCYVHVQD